jgi:hypothetical protein
MNKFQIKLINDAYASLSKLTDWERKFICNMRDLVDDFPETTLTHMQNRTLNTINTKVVALEQSRPIHQKYWEQPELLVPLQFGSDNYRFPDEEESE